MLSFFILESLLCIFTTVVALSSRAAHLDGSISSRNHCPSGAHIIGTPGQGDADSHQFGLLQSLVDSVMQSIPGSDTHIQLYPAEDQYNNGLNTTSKGTRRLHAYLKRYHQRCPQTKIVLLGYSSGAIINMNVLCGSTAPWNNTRPIAQEYINSIVASVVYGDETRQSAQPYNLGTCSGVGEHPRGDPAGCHNYEDIMQSYCDSGDPYCCVGGTDPNDHYVYPGEYDQVATNFVQNQFDSAGTTKRYPTPLSNVSGYRMQGCFGGGVLNGPSFSNNSNSLESCASFCSGYSYFAVENGNQCSCSNTQPSIIGSTGCSTACAANAAETCGGFGAKNLYYNPSI